MATLYRPAEPEEVGRGALLRSPSYREYPALVFSREANFPPDLGSGTGGALGSPLRIGVGGAKLRAGDLYITLDAWRAGSPNPGNPFAMTTLHAVTVDSGPRRVQTRVAVGSESGNEIWLDTSGATDRSRSGVLGLFRNATIADSAVATGGTTPNVPTLTNPIAGSMLVAFACAGTSLAHNFTPNGDLVELQQHAYEGTGAYAFPENSILAIEENLPAGVISGRSFSVSNLIGSLAVFGIILQRTP